MSSQTSHASQISAPDMPLTVRVTDVSGSRVGNVGLRVRRRHMRAVLVEKFDLPDQNFGRFS
jgi:hypothetical protein